MSIEKIASCINITDIQLCTNKQELKQILEARYYLNNFIQTKINEFCGILDYKIERHLSNDKVYKKVEFKGAARKIQDECIHIIKDRVEDALRFSELLVRLSLYDQNLDFRLTNDEEVELFDYLKTYALKMCKIKKIIIKTEIAGQNEISHEHSERR